MAFDASNLSALAYANGFTQWHYKTSDSWKAVSKQGYFDSASFYMKPGDMVIINFTSENIDFGLGHKVGFIYAREEGYLFVKS